MIAVDRTHELSRQEIRVVANRLFTRCGYSRTSLAQVAEAAGISRTRLRAMFAVKVDLVRTGLDERYDVLVAALREHRGEGRVGDALRAALRTVLDYTPADQDDVADGWEAIDRDQQLDALLDERFAAYRQAIIEFIAEEIGQAPDDLTPRLVGETVFKAAVVTTRHWASTRNVSVSMWEAVDDAVAPILEGYAPRLERTHAQPVPAARAFSA